MCKCVIPTLRKKTYLLVGGINVKQYKMLLSLFLVQMNLKSCRIILYRVYMSIKSTSLLKLIILNFFLIIFVLCEKHIFNSTFCLTRDFLRISLRLRIFLWLFSTPLTVVFYPIFFLGFRANKVLLNWFENSIKQAATGNQQTIIGKSTRRLEKITRSSRKR